MEKNNLLIISEGYPYMGNFHSIFVKEQINYLKKAFGEVFVISPMAYFPRWSTRISYIKESCKYLDKPEDYSYDNVKVFFPKYIPLPTSMDCFSRFRLKLGFNIVNKIIKKNNLDFDLIHAHFIGHSGYIGTKLKELYKKPLILTGHGGDVYQLPFINKKWLEIIKNNLKSADRIITVSYRNRDVLINKLGVNQKKISYIPNGFDPKKFKTIDMIESRKKLDLPIKKKIILSVGSLLEVKGHKYLIEAMKEIKELREDVLCIIVGYGSTEKLSESIKTFGLDEYIKLVGGKVHSEIPLWINASDLFVLPSIYEGNPTVIPEALGCGKPIVATDVGGIPEVIKNNEVGYLVEPRSPKMLSEKIVEALEKEWNTKMIVRYAIQNYSWEKISADVLEVYDNVFSSNR